MAADAPDTVEIPGKLILDLSRELAHRVKVGAPGRLVFILHHDQRGVIKTWDVEGGWSRRADRETGGG